MKICKFRCDFVNVLNTFLYENFLQLRLLLFDADKCSGVVSNTHVGGQSGSNRLFSCVAYNIRSIVSASYPRKAAVSKNEGVPGALSFCSFNISSAQCFSRSFSKSKINFLSTPFFRASRLPATRTLCASSTSNGYLIQIQDFWQK